MADPRVENVLDRAKRIGEREVLSPLMAAKHKAQGKGHKVNMCPFGCPDERLDESGYCRHLVGFTADKKGYEPLVGELVGRGKAGNRVFRRVVKTRMVPDDNYEPIYDAEDGEPVHVMKPVLDECRKDDIFIRITTCFRVYRDVDKDKKTAKALAKATV